MERSKTKGKDGADMDISLEKILNCPCTHFEGSGSLKDAGSVLKAYWNARARGEKEGFTPILLPAEDEHFLEAFTWEEYRDMEAYRKQALSEPVADGKAWLARRREEYQGVFTEDGFDPAVNLRGPSMRRFSAVCPSFCPCWTSPVVLAEIPTRNPWEVFAWVPFGGWNKCPAPEEHMAVAKYWFEKYGAVLGVITRNALEYTVSVPVSMDAAMDLAWEQYAFCPNATDKRVGWKADILSRSTVWSFWWERVEGKADILSRPSDRSSWWD